jgi:hypothetical protein
MPAGIAFATVGVKIKFAHRNYRPVNANGCDG